MSKLVEKFTSKNERLPIFYVLSITFTLVLLVSLGYRQIFLYEKYVQQGDIQSLRRVIKPGARGDIFDRNGKLIVGNEPVFSAVVYLDKIRGEFREEYIKLKKSIIKDCIKNNQPIEINVGKIYAKASENVLSKYLSKINFILNSNYSFPHSEFKKHFSQRTLLPLPLISRLKPREHAILAEKLSVYSPIQITTDTGRYYPYRDVAAHALGYVSANFDLIEEDMEGDGLTTYAFKGKTGKSGIEKAFDSTLSGQSGYSIFIVDPKGFQYDLIKEISPKKGNSVTCSLDIELQQTIEEAFKERKGAAIVLDVKTGEVLSLVSKPSYDLNNLSPFIPIDIYKDITEREAWLNRATQGLYPPGSTFKIVTACSALMNNVIDGNTVVECTGGLKIGNRTFPCHRKSGHGKVDIKKAISESCNVFFYQTGLNLGIDKLSQTANMFGMNKKFSFELLENSSSNSIIPTPKYKKEKKWEEGPWSKGDTANTSIGQGYILETPMQVACMIASFARKETLTKPSIIHNPNRITDIKYHGGEKLNLSNEQYKMILDGMKEATITGTSKRGRVDNVETASKSGTAQVTVKGRPLTLAWMIGFAPADNPEIAFCIVIEGEEPGDASGGKTAGPIMKALLEKHFETKIISDE